MRWSIRIVTVGGTEVRLHLTFLMFLAWIGFAAWINAGPAKALDSLIFIALLFFCIVVHEFGHILAARRFGIRTPKVTLLPIGGVSQLERMPKAPREELLVALAGPAVSLGIAGLLLLWLGHMPAAEDLGALRYGDALITELAAANLVLAVFNLLPAFPMDGGRVLRALLAIRLGYARGTRVAAAIGEVAAILLGFVGLIASQPILLFIALFLYIAAVSESGVSLMRDSLKGLTAADVMVRVFVTLPANARLADAAEALMRTGQHEFPIVDEGHTALLTRDALLAALRAYGPDAPIASASSGELNCVAADTAAEAAMHHLEAGEPLVGVTDAGELVGLVTWENLSEQMMISQAVHVPQPSSSRRLRRS
jgi:stage IV sporulation protein FB